MRRRLESERGAVTFVEAAIAYPIVIVLVAFVLYLGFYLMQNAILLSRAYEVATIAGRCAAHPGYYNLGADIDQYDFTELPSQPQISATMEDYALLTDAYRYWVNTLGDADEINALEVAYRNLATSSGFLGGNVNCDISIKRSGISHYVTVTITGAPDMPGMFKVIGLEDIINYNIVARAPVMDSSEFVRNTDLVVDFTSFLMEKFQVGDKFDVFFSRIKTCVTDIFK